MMQTGGAPRFARGAGYDVVLIEAPRGSERLVKSSQKQVDLYLIETHSETWHTHLLHCSVHLV